MNNTTLALAAWLLYEAAFAADCAYEIERMAEHSVDGIERLEIRAGTGELVVLGESGARSVQASGKACAASRGQLDATQIRLERDGSTLVLETLLPTARLNPRAWFRGAARLDVTVAVPADLALDIVHTNGATRVANVAETHLEDGSGELEVENVNGELRIRDGAGSLKVRNVKGSVRVTSAAGDVGIAQVIGDVIVVEQDTGDIDIEGVQGNVTIGSSGSGDIRIDAVTGSVRIEAAGRGDIRIARVRHDVLVTEHKAGDVLIDDIAGDLTVEKAASVHYSGVGGRVRIAGAPALSELPSDEGAETTELDEDAKDQ
jgi:hypothetical protein